MNLKPCAVALFVTALFSIYEAARKRSAAERLFNLRLTINNFGRADRLIFFKVYFPDSKMVGTFTFIFISTFLPEL